MNSETLVIILILLWLTTRVRVQSSINVPLIALMAWTPALIFTSLPYHFIQPTYQVLNSGISTYTYFVIFLAFSSFYLGSMNVTTGLFTKKPILYKTSPIEISVSFFSLRILYLLGFIAFLYAFKVSGLSEAITKGNISEIFASRLKFHVGFINHFIIFMDIAAIIFFVRFLEQKKAIDALPMLITLLCFAATLQKSRVIFMVLSIIFLTLLYKQQSKHIFFGNWFRKSISILAVCMLIMSMLLMNSLRGITKERNMDYDSPVLEQLFIYSGAPALLNLSATIEGNIQTNAPTYGLIALRSLFWKFKNREELSPNGYLEGINNGTSLIFYWHDFYLSSVIILTYACGFLTKKAFFLAKRHTLIGILLGCLAFNATVMTIYTDQFFEPQTFITLVLILITGFFTSKTNYLSFMNFIVGHKKNEQYIKKNNAE